MAIVYRGDRGFAEYGDEPLRTSYGHQIRLYESSAATGPHVWLGIDAENATNGDTGKMAAHLDLLQAATLHGRLEQYLNHVRTTWQNGEQRVTAAIAKAAASDL